MGGLALLFILPLLAYCLVQTSRDLKKRNWPLAVWGGLIVIMIASTLPRLLIGAQH